MVPLFKNVLLMAFALCLAKSIAQCPANISNISVSPVKAMYCTNDPVTLTFTHSSMLLSLTWRHAGANISTTPANVITFDPIGTDGNILVTGNLKGCGTFTFPVVLNISPPMAVDAGPNVLITGSPAYATIGGTPTVSGGTSPYTYLWTPAGYFVGGTTSNSSNPQVNPPNNTNYQVTVTDNAGCFKSASARIYNAGLLTNNKNYAILKRELDAGYMNSAHIAASNLLYFMFEEEYYVPSGTNLNYKIYDDAGTQLTGLPSLVETIGDNRFALDVSGLSNGYYKLLVYNQKNEIWKTRIKVN